VKLLLVFSFLFLISCGQTSAPVQAPQNPKKEKVVVRIWETPISQPIVLIADEAIQEASNFRQVKLRGVVLHMPLRDGRIMVHSPEAGIQGVSKAQGEKLTLAPPITFSGTFGLQPFVGAAESAKMDMEVQSMTLEMPQMYMAHQHIRSRQLIIKDSWKSQQAIYPSAVPAPAAIQSAVAALPHPLLFAPEKTR
jgi:hypothetical protein